MLTEFSSKGVRYAAYGTFLLTLLASPARTFAGPGAPVALVWAPSTDKSVAGYNIYYGSKSRSYTNVVSAGSLTSTTVSNLLAGTKYFFAATSYTAAGLESDYSVEASYTIPTNAILRASATVSIGRNLTVLGLVGNNYQIQYSTNLAPGGIWYPLTNFTQTVPSQSFSLDPSTRQIFYRAQQK